MFESLLSFLFLGWFFWPLSIGLLLGAYAVVKDADEFPTGSLFLLGSVLGFCLYRYPELRDVLFSIKGAAYSVGGYILAGGVVSLWKWVTVLLDFRRDAPEHLKKVNVNQPPGDRAKCLSRFIYGSGRDLVKESAGSFYPDYRRFPIATWWTYWPLFLFQVILDPITRAIRRFVNFFRDIYEAVAKRFSVS